MKVKKGELISNQGGLLNEFDLDEKSFSLTNNEATLEIIIPGQEEMDNVDLDKDKIIFSSDDLNYDVIIENIDGGIRQLINIESADAPNKYEFEMILEEGDSLQMQEDGGAIVKTAQDEVKSVILQPWAKDANGMDLYTFYEARGNTLIQTVNFENAVFPVVADPIWCGNAIKSVVWITRDGKASASVTPTWCGATGGGGFQWGAWSEMVNKTPNSRRWDKKYGTNTYWSMYNQYFCHADWAGPFKTPWNLEPWRPNVGYAKTVAKGCNP
jgi:hypothetical protein